MSERDSEHRWCKRCKTHTEHRSWSAGRKGNGETRYAWRCVECDRNRCRVYDTHRRVRPPREETKT